MDHLSKPYQSIAILGQTDSRFNALWGQAAHLTFFVLLLVAFALQGSAYGLDDPSHPVAERAQTDDRYRLVAPREGGLAALFRWRADRKPLVAAHRGGPKPGFPENAIETFEEVRRYGPPIVEMDVRQLRDGTLILMHDRRLDRTTTLKGLVAEQSWETIKDAYLRDNAGTITPYRIPTLADALMWADGKALLNVDIKRGVKASDIIDQIKKLDAFDRVILITYNLDQARRLQALAPNAMMTVSGFDQDSWQALSASELNMERVMIWTGTRVRDTALYNQIHQSSRYVVLGTLGFNEKALDRVIAASGDEKRYLSFFAQGADMLSTDRYWAVYGALGYTVKR